MLLNCPGVFCGSVNTLLAFHEWVEHEFPEYEDETSFYWFRKFPRSLKLISLRLPKNLFTVTKERVVLMKHDAIREWIEEINVALVIGEEIRRMTNKLNANVGTQ